MKLILGTAEFGPKAYGEGRTEPLSLNIIRSIMECAKHGGIEILEGAESYKCDELLQDLNFDLIYKVAHPYNLNNILERTGRNTLLGLLYHHGYKTRAETPLADHRVMYRGVSVYSHSQVSGTADMVEVPLNLENQTFENLTAKCKLVRSIFNRGELLKRYSVKDCVDYVKSIPNIHGVIVGVNSVKELEQVLEAWQ